MKKLNLSADNEQFVPANFSLNPQAAQYANSMQGASNHNMQGTSNVPGHWAEIQVSTLNVQQVRNIPSHCPVQKVKIKDEDRNFVEAFAMLDSGANTSFISKNVTKKLGLSGPKVHITMNLAGGQKKSEESELVNITVVPISEKTMMDPQRRAITTLRTIVCYPQRKPSRERTVSGMYKSKFGS